MFVSYQASIENQFEKILSQWMDDPNFPCDGAGHDLLAGTNQVGGRTRVISLWLPTAAGSLVQTELQIESKFTTLDGACYAFVPSIKFLTELVEKVK